MFKEKSHAFSNCPQLQNSLKVPLKGSVIFYREGGPLEIFQVL